MTKYAMPLYAMALGQISKIDLVRDLLALPIGNEWIPVESWRADAGGLAARTNGRSMSVSLHAESGYHDLVCATVVWRRGRRITAKLTLPCLTAPESDPLALLRRLTDEASEALREVRAVGERERAECESDDFDPACESPSDELADDGSDELHLACERASTAAAASGIECGINLMLPSPWNRSRAIGYDQKTVPWSAESQDFMDRTASRQYVRLVIRHQDDPDTFDAIMTPMLNSVTPISRLEAMRRIGRMAA